MANAIGVTIATAVTARQKLVNSVSKSVHSTKKTRKSWMENFSVGFVLYLTRELWCEPNKPILLDTVVSSNRRKRKKKRRKGTVGNLSAKEKK